MKKSGLSRNEQCELRSGKSALRIPHSAFLQFSAMAAFSALFLMLCCQARAQERPNGSPNGQKSPERAVPASAELLKKAMKNARAIAPDDTQEHTRPVETKTPPNSAQPKLLPDSNSLPDSPAAKAPKKILPTPIPSKESDSKPDTIKQDADRNAQSESPQKAVDESDGSVWEPTGITVSRLFLATDGTNGEVRKVPMSVPVLYESRLMALDKDKQRAIARLLDKLVSYRTRLAAIRKEGADLLAEWNQIISSSTPQDLLLSDSPSLIEKESTDAAGHGESTPGFEPGKGVSIQLKSTAPNQ
jgi:hypothetical protein